MDKMIVRTQQPQTYSPEFKPIPRPEESTLSNGLKIYSYNLGKQQVFRLELIFRVGAADFENPSIASITGNMLKEGTKQRSAEELNNLLDFYGSFLEIKCGLDLSTLTLYGRSEFLSVLLPVIGEVLNEPAFTAEALEKHKKLAIQNLEISQKKTSYWSVRMLRKSVFGESHPYSTIPSVDKIKQIELTDIARFHKMLLQSFETILIAGSFSQAEVENSLANNFGNIAIARMLKKVIKPGYFVKSLEKELPGSTQASIALGTQAISTTDKNFPLQGFIIKLLGGYFGSRLMKSLREDKGLTYGVHAYVLQLLHGNFIQITSDVKHESVEESVNIVKEEIKQLLINPVTEAEVNTVRNYMLGEYVNDTNTAFDFAGLYKKIIIQELPDNYYDTYFGKIANISLNEIEAFKHRILDPDKFSIVKVF